MKLRDIWERLTTTSYARMLETELMRTEEIVALLRAENRALLNSILGIAGVPPIPDEHRSAAGNENFTPSGSAWHASADTNREGAARVASPMRRRSWQQINRMLELESSKKKTPETN